MYRIGIPVVGGRGVALAASLLFALVFYFLFVIAISIAKPNTNPADMNNIISSISLPLVSLIRR
jgi:uncharacterized protein YggT (Ycf19 family)